MGTGNVGNLVRNEDRTPEERRANASKAGKASVRARRLRKTLRESLIELMAAKIPKESPYFLRAQADMEALGLKGAPMVQDLATIGLLKKAVKGDQAAFATLRDTMGEKPIEQHEMVNPPEPIVLGVIPDAIVEKAKREKQEMENHDAQK